MLTVKDFNRITFLHHRGIVPPAPAKEGEHVVEKRYVCSANMKLIEYGYTMSYDLFMAFCNATHAAFLEAWSALYDLLWKTQKLSPRLLPSGRISQTMRWKLTLLTCMWSICSTT